jgi:hypothetical protein
MVVGLSFSFGFSSNGENSCENAPELSCDTLAVRVNARVLFPVIFEPVLLLFVTSVSVSSL